MWLPNACGRSLRAYAIARYLDGLNGTFESIDPSSAQKPVAEKARRRASHVKSRESGSDRVADSSFNHKNY